MCIPLISTASNWNWHGLLHRHLGQSPTFAALTSVRHHRIACFHMQSLKWLNWALFLYFSNWSGTQKVKTEHRLPPGLTDTWILTCLYLNRARPLALSLLHPALLGIAFDFPNTKVPTVYSNSSSSTLVLILITCYSFSSGYIGL